MYTNFNEKVAKKVLHCLEKSATEPARIVGNASKIQG
jgi:hypothetical protein